MSWPAGRVAWRRSLNWEQAALGLVLLAAAYFAATILARSLAHPTSQPHFQVLAAAFLHGHLDVPAGTYDAAFYNGRLYLPFGPLPAVILLPVVAVSGTAFPVGLLAIAAALAAAPSLLWHFRLLDVTDPLDRAWLLVLSLGCTCYLAAMVSGSTYFVSHLVLVACLTPALGLALSGRSPWLAGALVGLGTLTRAPAVAAGLPLLLIYFQEGKGDRIRVLLQFAAGLLPWLAVLGWYNLARFGNPLEAGYTYQLQGDPTLAAAKAAGTLALAHLPKNLYDFLVAPPLPIGGDSAPFVRYPYLVPSEWGTGLIFISPWLLGGLAARGRRAALLGFGAVLLLVPGLLQFGGGWVQFGYRYSLDALPFTAGLAAIALSQRPRWRGRLPALAAFCLLVNAWGADWLVRRLGA